MKVDNLKINRRASYDSEYPNQLVGIVQIHGEHGKMEVKLSNVSVGKIFAIIKEDVTRTAKYNAGQAEHAIDDVGGEIKLIEQAV